MRKAVSQALKGAGFTHPNPRVGAIYVKGDRILGSGYHHRYGAAHAEVQAAKSGANLRGSTCYVTLEPCSHYGKTPPCADFLINSGVRRVVVGTRDINPKVSGKGIRRLRQAGIRVDVGVLENVCRDLNKAFFYYHETGMAYLRLKLAMSWDGAIADGQGRSKWITGAASRALVHQIRRQVDGVMAGSGTVLKDNPRLSARIPSQSISQKKKIKLILSPQLNIPTNAAIFKEKDSVVIIFTACLNPQRQRSFLGLAKLVVIRARKGPEFLRQCLKECANMGFLDVMLEGGAQSANWAMRSRLVNEVHLFINPAICMDPKALRPFDDLTLEDKSFYFAKSNLRAQILKNMDIYIHPEYSNV